MYKDVRGDTSQWPSKKQLHISVPTPPLLFHFFFFYQLYDSLLSIKSTLKTIPDIFFPLLKPISHRETKAKMSFAVSNMHLSLCIPNSDCRRLPAKEVLRRAEESYLLSLIMFVRHSVETAVTPGRAFVPTCFYGGGTACGRKREREEKSTLLSSGEASQKTHMCCR